MIIYENDKVLIDEKSSSNYEVLVKRYHKRDSYLDGRLVKQKGDVKLPSPSEWGKYGFTFNEKRLAYRKALEISLGV